MAEEFNLYPLHVFRLLARSGNVTRTAQELFVSQPAVSAHLKLLEQRYGEPLFERTARGMILTTMGLVVLEQANKLFALYEEIPHRLNEARGIVQGEITLAASSTPGAYCVPELLKRFQAQYPAARPTLMVGASGEVLEWLREYRVPLGVVGELAMDEGLHRLEIGADELRLVTAGDDALFRAREIKAKHVQDRILFLRERGSSTRANAETLLADLIPSFRRVVELRNTDAIKQAVASGLGVAVLSSWATRLEESAGLLRPVRDTRFKHQRRFYLVRRQDRRLSGSAAALWESLKTRQTGGRNYIRP